MRISNEEFNKVLTRKCFGDNIVPKGKAVLTWCDVSSKEAQEMEKKVIKAYKEGTWEKYRKILDKFHGRFMTKQVVLDNTVTRNGREVLARILSGDNTYTGEIKYCELGSADTASTTGDTALGDYKYRKQVSSKAYSTYTTYVSTFFTAAETTGTYKEIGHYIDGTAAENSGVLFSRIADPETAELPITKTATSSLTIDYSVSL